MQNIFIDVLPPWVETGLQPAFYDLESGTVLQQTARMYAKVNEIATGYSTFTTNVTNEVNRFEQDTNDEIERFEQDTNDEIKRFEGVVNNTVEEYIQKFNDLHDYVEDYFDNLDVQKEINNKLDEMASDGTLADIISLYLQSNATMTYNTVADLKLAENLVNGSFAKTLGYRSINDGGCATYKVRTITNDDVVDEAKIIELHDDTLIAELIFDKYVSPEQFGCYGDDTHDDTANFQKLLNANKAIKLTSGKTYKVTSTLTVPNNTNMYGDGVNTKIKSYITDGAAIFRSTDSVQHFDIENFSIDAINNCVGFYFNNPYDQCVFKNLYFDNFINSAIKCGTSSTISQTLVIDNCVVYMSGTENSVAPIVDLTRCYECNILNSKFLFRSGNQQAFPCLQMTRAYDANIRGNSFANSTTYGLLITGDSRHNSIIGNTFELISGDYSIGLIGINSNDILHTLIIQPYTYYSAPNKIYCENESNGTFIGMASVGGRRNIIINVNDPNVTNPNGNVNVTQEANCLSMSGIIVQDHTGTAKYKLFSNSSAGGDYGLRLMNMLNNDAMALELLPKYLGLNKNGGRIQMKSPNGNIVKYIGINDSGELIAFSNPV